MYEKIFSGVWSFRGNYDLVDYSYNQENNRKVFKFVLKLSEDKINKSQRLKERNRIIPTSVKMEVWKRDMGKCVKCGSKDELHFDHDIPYSKVGSSISAENVKILCALHILSKSDKIM